MEDKDIFEYEKETRDFRISAMKNHDLFICERCGKGAFMLTKTIDSIFPDVICLNCGDIHQVLREK